MSGTIVWLRQAYRPATHLSYFGMEVSISASVHKVGGVRILIRKAEVTVRHVNLKIERS